MAGNILSQGVLGSEAHFKPFMFRLRPVPAPPTDTESTGKVVFRVWIGKSCLIEIGSVKNYGRLSLRLVQSLPEQGFVSEPKRLLSQLSNEKRPPFESTREGALGHLAGT